VTDLEKQTAAAGSRSAAAMRSNRAAQERRAGIAASVLADAARPEAAKKAIAEIDLTIERLPEGETRTKLRAMRDTLAHAARGVPDETMRQALRVLNECLRVLAPLTPLVGKVTRYIAKLKLVEEGIHGAFGRNSRFWSDDDGTESESAIARRRRGRARVTKYARVAEPQKRCSNTRAGRCSFAGAS